MKVNKAVAKPRVNFVEQFFTLRQRLANPSARIFFWLLVAIWFISILAASFGYFTEMPWHQWVYIKLSQFGTGYYFMIISLAAASMIFSNNLLSIYSSSLVFFWLFSNWRIATKLSPNIGSIIGVVFTSIFFLVVMYRSRSKNKRGL